MMSLAFSTFSEDWGLQEQCDILFLELSTPLELIAALKMEPLSF